LYFRTIIFSIILEKIEVTGMEIIEVKAEMLRTAKINVVAS